MSAQVLPQHNIPLTLHYCIPYCLLALLSVKPEACCKQCEAAQIGDMQTSLLKQTGWLPVQCFQHCAVQKPRWTNHSSVSFVGRRLQSMPSQASLMSGGQGSHSISCLCLVHDTMLLAADRQELSSTQEVSCNPRPAHSRSHCQRQRQPSSFAACTA